MDSDAYPVSRLSLTDLPVRKKIHPLIALWKFFDSLISKNSDQRTSRQPILSTLKSKKMLPFLFVIIALIIFSYLYKRPDKTVAKKITPADEKTKISRPRASLAVNREFSFPLQDTKGKEIAQLKYLIETAELRDQIIVQGKIATAIEGKTFLILTLKIQNTFDKAIDINARDYIRLIVNGNSNEQIAAEIHNDPVNVQAISTKTTRIGFPINTIDTDLSLLVGEITGNKEPVDLKF